ncbi:hypothetical protein SNE40_008443 [Patella caerulea]|uniref:MARVEL domain-containing protein n=1 Tax=Patella caerulea TaxID=87958 RepID=A0AAN8PV64_PATCE
MSKSNIDLGDVVDVSGTEVVTQPEKGAESKEIRVCGCSILLSIGYAKSIHGILRATQIVLSLIGFICVSSSRNIGCDYLYSKTYNFYESVTLSCFISAALWYLIYLMEINQRFFLRFMPWSVGHAVWCIIFGVLLFISSCMLAANYCYQAAFQAGTAFGFFSCIVYGADGFLTVKELKAERDAHLSRTPRSPTQAPDVDLDRY